MPRPSTFSRIRMSGTRTGAASGDGGEVLAGLNPRNDDDDARILDLDGDGLSDQLESDLGTSAERADSDGDGISDRDELIRGIAGAYDSHVDTDPLDADTDDDGLSDFDERFGSGPLAAWAPTDPLDHDSDDDGIPDGVEVGRVLPLEPMAPGGGGTDPTQWWPDGDPTTTTDPQS